MATAAAAIADEGNGNAENNYQKNDV